MRRVCRLAALLAGAGMAGAQSPAHQPPGTIVVDASEFYHEIPAGDTTGGGFGANNAEWLFNNSILNLVSKEDAVARIAIPEPGRYRCFSISAMMTQERAWR